MANTWWVVIYEDQEGNLKLRPSHLGSNDADPLEDGDSVIWVNDTEESYTVGSFTGGLSLIPAGPYTIGPHATSQTVQVGSANQAGTYTYACTAVGALSAVSADDSVNGIIIVDSTKPPQLPSERREKGRRSKSKRQGEPELVGANSSRR